MRKEITLFVIEDMTTTGTTFAELVQDGELQPAWNPIAQRLLERAADVFTVTDDAGPSR